MDMKPKDYIAYTYGAIAYNEGEGMINNPYPVHAPEYSDWNLGFIDRGQQESNHD